MSNTARARQNPAAPGQNSALNRLASLAPPGSRLRSIARQIAGIRVPKELQANHRLIDDEVDEALSQFIRTEFASADNPGYFESDAGKADIAFRLNTKRIAMTRDWIVPWISQSMSLKGAKVLEIGCGSGCNLVGYAEQGAVVTGVDIDPAAVKIAQKRCELYGFEVDALEGNAETVHELVDIGQYDLVMFYASLEHMTDKERSETMSNSWQGLKKGALWGLVETPNRLWFTDGHTSWMPFWHWLPDELALPALRRSPKPRLRELAKGSWEENRIALRRRGRGMSFHEFDLYMQPVEELDVVSSADLYLRRHSLAAVVKWLISKDRVFEKFLRKLSPGIHRGFFQANLNLLIRKSS